MSIINFERKTILSKDDLEYRGALLLLTEKASEEHYSKHNSAIAKLLLCLFWGMKFDITSLRILDDRYLNAALTSLSSYSFLAKNIESLIKEEVILSIAKNHGITKNNIENE